MGCLFLESYDSTSMPMQKKKTCTEFIPCLLLAVKFDEQFL
jgi:hypothetical protein